MVEARLGYPAGHLADPEAQGEEAVTSVYTPGTSWPGGPQGARVEMFPEDAKAGWAGWWGTLWG